MRRKGGVTVCVSCMRVVVPRAGAGAVKEMTGRRSIHAEKGRRGFQNRARTSVCAWLGLKSYVEYDGI
jgi:hypothetical protein